MLRIKQNKKLSQINQQPSENIAQSVENATAGESRAISAQLVDINNSKTTDENMTAGGKVNFFDPENTSQSKQVQSLQMVMDRMQNVLKTYKKN